MSLIFDWVNIFPIHYAAKRLPINMSNFLLLNTITGLYPEFLYQKSQHHIPVSLRSINCKDFCNLMCRPPNGHITVL